MARLLLHIGSPKTGSSAIQQALGRCLPALATNRVDVPTADFVPRDSLLDSGNGEWLANFCTGIWPEASAKGELVLQRLAAIAADRRDVILSSENFSYSTPSALQRVCQIVQPAFEEVSVVMYVRNPVDMCFSLWLQGVKRSFSRPIDIDEYAESFEFDALSVLQRFQLSLPDAKLFLRNYDDLRHDVVPDFFHCLCEFFRLADDVKGDLLSASKSALPKNLVNRSLYAEEVYYMQRLTEILCQMRVPEENILEAKRIASDLLLGQNGHGSVATCPPATALKVGLSAQPVVDALNQQFGLNLRSDPGVTTPPTTLSAPKSLIQAMAAIAAAAVCRIPPSLPVVFLREGDAFEFDGYVDHVSPVFVSGWVVCKEFPTSSVLVLVEVGGTEITLVANIHRPDVATQYSTYSAYCGFYHEFDGPDSQSVASGNTVTVSVLGSCNPLAKADMGI